jgi:cysteine synthase A
VALALKARKPSVRIVLADPPGSALYAWKTRGVLELEGSSITEGIGQSRVPGNLEGAPIDAALRIPDEEMLEQVFDLTIHEGLCVGGSAGLNVAAAIRVARDLGPGHTVVTVLCDGGARYQSKLFNPEFLRGKGLPVPPWMA